MTSVTSRRRLVPGRGLQAGLRVVSARPVEYRHVSGDLRQFLAAAVRYCAARTLRPSPLDKAPVSRNSLDQSVQICWKEAYCGTAAEDRNTAEKSQSGLPLVRRP